MLLIYFSQTARHIKSESESALKISNNHHVCDKVYLWQMTEKPEDGSDFIVTGDKEKLQPKEAEEEKKEEVTTDFSSL